MTWLERIDIARKVGQFSKSDRWDSASWKHCAVGEFKHSEDMPEDHELAYLGTNFHCFVGQNRFDEAEQCYKEIRYLCQKSPQPSQ